MLKPNIKIGLLTLIKNEKRKRRNYWLCKCKCGNEKWIRSDSLTKKNPTESCGCLSKETQIKSIDITGKKYNRLIVIKFTGEGAGRREEWLCKCECGNYITYTKKQLYSNDIKSCGCRNYESKLENIKKAFNKLKEIDYIDGTSIMKISKTNLIKSNTSGVTGIQWDNSISRY